MSMRERAALLSFFLQVLLFAAACFMLWYQLSAIIAQPAIGLTNLAITALYPEWVEGIFPQDADAVLVLTPEALSMQGKADLQTGEQMGLVINTRIVSYSLAFYSALHLATRQANPLERYLYGCAILWCLVVLGTISVCLKQLLVTLGEDDFASGGLLPIPPFMIALMYQLNTLIVPTLAPVLVWAWQSRGSQLFKQLSR